MEPRGIVDMFEKSRTLLLASSIDVGSGSAAWQLRPNQTEIVLTRARRCFDSHRRRRSAHFSCRYARRTLGARLILPFLATAMAEVGVQKIVNCTCPFERKASEPNASPHLLADDSSFFRVSSSPGSCGCLRQGRISLKVRQIADATPLQSFIVRH